MQQVGDQVATLRLIGAEREDLLELIHQDHKPLGPGRLAQDQPRSHVQRALAVLATLKAVEDDGADGFGSEGCQGFRKAEKRLGTGPADRPRPGGAAVELALFQGRHQPGPGQRRLAAARGPYDRQEPVLDPGRLALQRVEQPFRQRLAAEEQRGVLDVKQLQAAIRVLPLEDGPPGPRARLDPPNAADQPVECLGVVECVAEFDPGRRGQEAREFTPFRPLDPWQQDGDDPKRSLAVIDTPAYGHLHFLVVPRTEAPGADYHSTGGALSQGGLDLWHPGGAGDQVPLVEPGLQVLAGQSPG